MSLGWLRCWQEGRVVKAAAWLLHLARTQKLDRLSPFAETVCLSPHHCPSLPSLCCTPGAYYVAPNLFKTAARPITSDQQRFFQQIPLAGCAGAALAIAFCQCLIYQASGCGGLG